MPQQPREFSATFADLGSELHTSMVDWETERRIRCRWLISLAADRSAVHTRTPNRDSTSCAAQVSDEFGNVATVERELTITTVLLTEDPECPGNLLLIVGGTHRNDQFDFKLKKKDTLVEVTLNGNGLAGAGGRHQSPGCSWRARQ